ncbi:hypothetical protein CHR55_27835 [Rhodococcus qingshengii]|uniref:receptor protein-tyrosine kinase n=2 Tax=Rhodococcus qingshengii TaxID=334542 RepID=A0A2A5J3A0_RHOSG|nr:hypothetical protein CHR55_27835 [Rhodococcus qingshengii]
MYQLHTDTDFRSRRLSVTTWRHRSIAAVCAAGTSAALVVGSSPASAAPLPSECVESTPGGTVTCTYTDPSAVHALTLPDDITSITVTAIGGEGVGTTFARPGGVGAVVTATIPLTQSTIYAVVGGNGVGKTGGANGGGSGSGSGAGKGGGGGASDVRLAPDDLASRQVIAAGGGGAGVNTPGGAAGAAPVSQAGLDTERSGKPGTAQAGGEGGTFQSPGPPGAPGTLGQGGAAGVFNGPTNSPTAGGGGGGLYGGGGGAFASGGGGGSSLDPDGGQVVLASRGTAPSVTISYTPPIAPPGVLEVTHTSDTSTPVTGGQVVNYTTTFTNTGVQPVPVDHTLVLSGVLDDADLISGPTSGDPALTLSPGAGVDTHVTGVVAPGQTVTITYSVTVKPYAQQGDHNLVTQVTEIGSTPSTPPGACAGAALCTEIPSADDAAVPLMNLGVTGAAAAVVAVGGGTFMLVRRRKTGTSH